MKESKAHSTRKHSNFAASSSKRWMNCPGSVALSKKAPPQIESSYAKEGTDAHECLEFLVRRYGAIEKAKKEALNKWPAEMVEHGVASAHTIYKLRPSKDAKLLIETRVYPIPTNKELFGTLDYAWVDIWGPLVIIDYKYGAGVPVLPVDPDTNEGNSQLMYYGLGLAQKYKFEFSHVKLAIIQPRVWKEDEDPLTEGTVTMRALRQFEREVKAAVQIAKQPGAELKPAPSDADDNWCRWCPAASFCPAISKMQLSNADIAFDVETGIAPNTMPEVGALTPETLPKVLDACDLLDVWIEKVRAHAFQLASDGHKIAGRKLVEKRTTRFWLPEAEKEAKELFGKGAFVTEMLSPAQLEKQFGKEAKEFTKEYTDNKSSGYSLVSMKDSRPEVTSIVAFEVDEREEA